MKTSQHKAQTLASIANTRDVLSQADAEGRALRGEFGIDRQLIALSEVYKAHKAAGRFAEAQQVKAQAYALINQQ